jgi:hypothetical protein
MKICKFTNLNENLINELKTTLSVPDESLFKKPVICTKFDIIIFIFINKLESLVTASLI